MIPREILKKIRQIEIRTNRLVSEALAGQYHSVFKGQGMNFDEVREYQPGDEVRSIDWNVTARVIREVLFFEPRRRGTDLNGALEFLLRVTPHRAIAVVISDFIGSPAEATDRRRGELRPQIMLLESLAQASFAMLRQANRRHDV